MVVRGEMKKKRCQTRPYTCRIFRKMRQPKKRISSPPPAEPASPIRSTSQLARELGLSRWTVSRVINGHPGVHPETVQRVRDAMIEHRFSPSPLAQGLRSGRTNLVGICAPGIDDYFLGPKLELLRDSLSQRGLQVMIGLTGGVHAQEIATLDHFRRLCVAGVILFASQLAPRDRTLTHFQEARIPLVMVDPLAARHSGSLGIDRALAARELMEHLLELGHRRFLTVGMSNGGLYTRTRLASLRATLEAHDLAPPEHLAHLPLLNASSDYEDGYLSAGKATEFLHSPRPPTALLAVNDRLALGLIAGLRQRGIEIPRDCSLAGYDNMEQTAYVSPRLTTTDPGAPDLMERAAARLLTALQPGAALPRPIAIRPRLIVRETTTAPPR